MLARDAAEESPEWRRRRRESIGKDTPRCVALFSTLDPTPTRPWALAQLRIGSGYGSGMGRPVVFYGLLATPLSMVTVAVAFISSWVEMRAPPPPPTPPRVETRKFSSGFDTKAGGLGEHRNLVDEIRVKFNPDAWYMYGPV